MGINDINARPYPYPGFGFDNKYEYIVGERALHNRLNDNKPCSCKSLGFAHHCLLYGDEIFELDDKGYHRRKKYDCQDFNEYEGFPDVRGTSTISPDNLDSYIRNFGNLVYNKYTN